MPYSISKTALLGLTKALSYELAPDNIRVNCIAPGIIDTKFAGAVSNIYPFATVAPFSGTIGTRAVSHSN